MPKRLTAHLKMRTRNAIRRMLIPLIVNRDRLPRPVRSTLRSTYRALPRPVRNALRQPLDLAVDVEEIVVSDEAPTVVTTERPSIPAVELPQRPPVKDTPVRLLVGPANFAGQGWQWSRAVEQELPGVGAEAYAYVKGTLDFPVDYGVPVALYARSKEWQEEQERHVLASYTHVLVEAERPILGTRYGPTCDGEFPVLRAGGLQVGYIAHGSDVRVPSRHIQENEWSPFADSGWEVVPVLERNASHNLEMLAGYEGYSFVSTPDLLDYVPRAAWCPVIVDPHVWATDDGVMKRRVPIVVHAPSSDRIKGSDLVDPIMQSLADRGVVDYRRIFRVPPETMPAIYRDADIVLDQFRIGSYGVAACEGMAAGRVVIGHITPAVRRTVRESTGLELPIVEATPKTLEEVVFGLLEDQAGSAATASAGPAFVGAVHDGRRSAHVLAPFLVGGTGD